LVECADLLDDVRADLCLGSGYLDYSAHVAEEDEGYSSQDSDVVNPACKDNFFVDMVLEFGSESCPLEMGNVASCTVRQGCSAWNRTTCLFF
jgi:hypothetical protein